MGNTATSQKKAIQVKAAQAVGGKPVCDPNAPCQPCHRTDLQLLVVVPSVVVSEHKSDIDLASYAFAPSFDAEFVGMKRNGSLPVARVMKQGFVYVYYLERQRWDLWQVAPSGLTRKIMHQVDTSKYAELQPGFGGEQSPKNCSRGAANVPAHLISISGALSANEVWLAYSSDVWTSLTLQRYADNPEVEMPGSAYKTVKRKLRDVRGRQINATSAAEGKLQPFCLPLNVAALEHAVLDFASKIGTKLSAGCEAVQHPLDPARCGMATKFEGEVRALERALGVGLKNREHYVNTTSILMLPDALGVAEAHTHINARTSAERQYWEAGGPDATGANKNPNRPWERQSLLQVGFIMDWVAAAEKRKADERYGQGTKFLISKAEYGFYISKRGTDKRVVPDSTRYKYNNFLQKYEVDLPPEAKEKRSATVAAESTGKRLKRYKKHLNNDAIVLANERWKNQAKEWAELKKKRDQDYVDWLQTASFAAAVRYDFDDQRAVSDVKRSAAQVRVDAQEAATRLRVMSRCFGGAGCSGVSLDYFALQFQKDVSDKTHHIAQATIEEFGFASKVIDKVKTDAGARADIYDAYLASTNAYKEFAQAWASIGVPPVSDTSSIIVLVTTINAHLRSQALQIQMGGKEAVAKALERATTRSAMWVRSAGLLNHIVSNHKQYAFSVAWGTNAFAGATDDTIWNVSTLRSPAVNIDLRGNLTGKQAVEGQQKARMEVRNHVATTNVQGLRNVEATSMILCDQDDLIRAARMRGEKLVEVVSPGLFGLDPKITRVPESWAREMVGQQKHLNWTNLSSKSGFLNFSTVGVQTLALLMSLDDVQSKGGWDQMDAAGSLLGALAGVTGGVMELGSMLTTPGTLNKMGTPFAAELAAKVPVHLWLKLGSGLCLGAGAIFDASVAFAKYRKADNNGDVDASNAYFASALAEGLGGISLGVGSFFAYRAAALDRLSQIAARQAAVRIFGAAFSPIMLARCLTGLGLILWLGGLGCSFFAMYLEDDDNEVFLKRSYFGNGHAELGRFRNLDHEVQSFGSLSTGTRAEMEWEDKLGKDVLKIVIKVFKPGESSVVTVRLHGYDGINGKLIRSLTEGALPPLKRSTDKDERAAGISTTQLAIDVPDAVTAVKLSYYVYPDAVKGTRATAMGDLWIED